MPKKHSLTGKTNFFQVLTKGTRIDTGLLYICYLAKEKQDGIPLFGIAAKKKHEKSAVKRNKLKRQVKEVLRNLVGEIKYPNIMAVIGLRKYAYNASFQDIEKAVKEAFARAGLLI